MSHAFLRFAIEESRRRGPGREPDSTDLLFGLLWSEQDEPWKVFTRAGGDFLALIDAVRENVWRTERREDIGVNLRPNVKSGHSFTSSDYLVNLLIDLAGSNDVAGLALRQIEITPEKLWRAADP